MMKQLPWQWAAQGKHPLVKDYIQLGREFPMVNVFADWVRNGYSLVSLAESERRGEGIGKQGGGETGGRGDGETGRWGDNKETWRQQGDGETGKRRDGENGESGRMKELESEKRSDASCSNAPTLQVSNAPTLQRSNAPTLQSFSHLRSFRFWTRGAGKDALVCGLVRDSSDRIGRPYPFLIMGAGTLPGWEENWDLISLACERTWRQMEHHTASVSRQPGQVADARRLEDDIMAIKPPISQWSELSQERDSCQGVSWKPTEMAGKNLDLSKEEVFIDLGQGHDHDYLILVSLWHRFLKDHYADMLKGSMPKAVFMGGTVDKISLAVFQRPLRPADFVLLWSS